MGTVFKKDDWLNGALEDWWNKNMPDLDHGLKVHAMLDEENEIGNKLLEGDDFLKIQKLQLEAFNKLAEIKSVLEYRLFKIKTENSLDISEAANHYLEKLKSEAWQLNDETEGRVLNGELNAYGFDGPSVKKILRLYENRDNLTTEQTHEFLKLWPKNKELEGRWRLLLISKIESNQKDGRKKEDDKIKHVAKKIKGKTTSKDSTYSANDIEFALRIFAENYMHANHYKDVHEIIKEREDCPTSLKEDKAYKRMLDWFHTYEQEAEISLK